MFRPTLVIIALLGLPATAQAGWKTERALETAYIVWGEQLQRVCPADIVIAYDDPRAAYSTEYLRMKTNAAWARPGVCRVSLNRDARTAETDAYEPFCSVVLHETGHIIGLDHSERGIMRPAPFFAGRDGEASGVASTTGRAPTGAAVNVAVRTSRGTGDSERTYRAALRSSSAIRRSKSRMIASRLAGVMTSPIRTPRSSCSRTSANETPRSPLHQGRQ
jgi:hypothetical protein